MKRTLLTASIMVVLVAAFSMPGCGWSNKAKGALVGSGAGAAVGGYIGSRSGNTAAGAIIGAAVGGAAGTAIGHYMDSQKEELDEELQNAKIERVGEGIKITFDSGILFQTASADLQPASEENIAGLANILQKYADTNILVEGHTDSQGSEAYNQTLSEQRAASVASKLLDLGVAPERVTTVGHGEMMPVADNETAEGRALNRRVEIAIFANDALKEKAESGELGSGS
ncbi:MAG TPA: OmpA family protein [Firmicutes bacterium]|nr:OmpA family protein [Bacillota bacterium]